MEVDGPHVLDAGCGQRHHDLGSGFPARHGRRGGTLSRPRGEVGGFVGPLLAKDPPLVGTEEPDERLGQRRVGVDGPTRSGDGIIGPGQVEEVSGDDEDAGAVPGIEGSRQFGRDGDGRRRGGRGEQEVADHHDPPTQRYVDPCPVGLGREVGRRCSCGHRRVGRRGLELGRSIGVGGGGHVQAILKGTQR